MAASPSCFQKTRYLWRYAIKLSSDFHRLIPSLSHSIPSPASYSQIHGVSSPPGDTKFLHTGKEYGISNSSVEFLDSNQAIQVIMDHSCFSVPTIWREDSPKDPRNRCEVCAKSFWNIDGDSSPNRSGLVCEVLQQGECHVPVITKIEWSFECHDEKRLLLL